MRLPQIVRPGQTRREAGTQSQGPRLIGDGGRPVAGTDRDLSTRCTTVKERITRVTWALAILASMALSLSAGMRWS
jgi:hypothetical protein